MEGSYSRVNTLTGRSANLIGTTCSAVSTCSWLQLISLAALLFVALLFVAQSSTPNLICHPGESVNCITSLAARHLPSKSKLNNLLSNKPHASSGGSLCLSSGANICMAQFGVCGAFLNVAPDPERPLFPWNELIPACQHVNEAVRLRYSTPA